MSTCYYDGGPDAAGRPKVMLATTAYDSPDASYTFSIQDSRDALAKAGVPTAYLLLSGNCHVDDARNAVVRDFLATDCTELVFIDADVSWRADGLLRLCRHEIEDTEIVGGVYPYRRNDTRKRLQGAPVRTLPGVGEPDHRGLLEVEGLPTGFLRIPRHVLERMAEESPAYHTRGGVISHEIFDRDILEDGGRRGGDIRFCMKWRELGGRAFADPEIQLGHVAKQVLWGSLGSALRKQDGSVLAYVAERIRTNTLKPHHLTEAWDFVDNRWTAQEDVLAFAIGLARQAKAPIVETGSGLSTVLMAAATEQTVFCIEHEPYWAERLKEMAHAAGVSNIAICSAPIRDGWYDPKEMEGLPERFAFGLVDGPPRALGSRMGFFRHLAQQCDAVLCDDADDDDYAEKVAAWGRAFGWSVQAREGRALLIRKEGK